MHSRCGLALEQHPVTFMIPILYAHCELTFTCIAAHLKKGKEEYLYSAFYILWISQSAQAWITQFYLQLHHACLSFVSDSPDGATSN